MTSIFVQSHIDQQLTSSAAASTQISERDSAAIERITSNLTTESYLKEIENLKKQVKALEIKNNVIQNEKEDLQNQVSDLKALMKRVGQEGEKNIKRVQDQNKMLEMKVSRLEKGLECSFEHSGHFDQIAEYWQILE